MINKWMNLIVNQYFIARIPTSTYQCKYLKSVNSNSNYFENKEIVEFATQLSHSNVPIYWNAWIKLIVSEIKT